MKVVFAVDVPDEFLERRCREYDQHAGACGVETSPVEYLTGRANDIAGDELPLAFWGWPIAITVEVTPA